MRTQQLSTMQRSGCYTWMLGSVCLIVLGMVSPVIAQQPTATIIEMVGNVTVNFAEGSSAPGSVGMALFQNDAIQTRAGAFAVLKLSDGSELELGENTNLLMEQLASDPSSGARVSRVKIWWGKLRALLSPGHQEEGASFDIQTPNALVGVKFSRPDVEVGFDLATNTTTVYAYTVDVVVLNLVSGMSSVVAAGTGATVFGNGIQLLPQIPQAAQLRTMPEPQTPQPPSTPSTPPALPESAASGGWLSGGIGTLAAVGLGAAAVAGGVVALTSSADKQSSESSDTGTFSGTFQYIDSIEPGVTRTVVLQISQNGRTLSGTRTETVVAEGCCTATGTGSVSGYVEGNVAYLTVVRGAGMCRCAGTGIIGVNWSEETQSGPATLENNGTTLNFNDLSYSR